ncbi:ribosome biogenesis GTPase YqeH [Fructobacillus tropaeoli]|uniref:GTP-binding protein YqeH n=1 Tax=Fructobacillus tropaeoli TaxID=709323 RepID=A0A3F3HGW9_9LACO|nr:GTP-binding protein YqeH [Fructobacillus tropaeoli]GIC70689.1 ribosome biogenesis GTPase YqeH [Fructobacillus tropaeoli]CAK1239399.1 Ribosome biogenesis GTPase RbgA (RbgA) [Fructobacillus tropaeoli]CAK1245827.1 Ribosome biogenesis GTPase RbgA (RbgA) [Fructobacillus tropaeoli]
MTEKEFEQEQVQTIATDEEVQEALAEGLYCIGCGAKMQIDHKEEAGFLPLSALKKQLMAEELLCQRCFRLRHYNEIQPVELTDDDFANLLHQVSKTKSLIVYVLDLFDFSGSTIPGLPRFVGQENPILVLANKVDLLPKSLKEHKLKNWVQGQLKEQGINPVGIELVSAAHPKNLDQILDKIDTLRDGRDVYVVGTTNVGKSTLINQIIKSKTGVQELITTSRFPGTTLDQIAIPLDDGQSLIDTPGIIKKDQYAHWVTDKDLKYVLPKAEIKSRTYQLNPDQTLFFGALARFDLVTGPADGAKAAVTAYFENNLMIHRTKRQGADDFYAKHKGQLLTPAPADENVDFAKYEFKINEKTDLVYAGLGFITLPAGIHVQAYAPKGVGVFLRKAMI